MNTVYETQNITLSEKLISIFRNNINKDSYLHLLEKLDKIIKWDGITEIVIRYLPEASGGSYRNIKVLTLIKCLILENIFNFSDYKLFVELADKDFFRNFTGINSPNKIPKIKIISSFRSSLMLNNIYDMIVESFYEQLTERETDILDFSPIYEKKGQNNLYANVDDTKTLYKTKMLEIEDRINKLSDKKLSTILSGTNYETAYDLRDKLLQIKMQIDRISSKKIESSSENFQKMLKVENSIININGIAEKLENNGHADKEKNKPESEGTEKLHNKIINSFFVSLEDNDLKNGDETATKVLVSDNIIQEKLKYTNKIIRELKDSLKNLDEISASKESPEQEKLNDYNEYRYPEEKIGTEIETEIKSEPAFKPEQESEPDIQVILPELKTEPLFEEEIEIPSTYIIYPDKKTEGIFNDENLTEDYELGFRFHKYGLKTGFFNVMLDNNNESTRISTAEFFPNTFWSSVRQRSRWIAGICFQNWKAHKWKGDLTTKYFMFRDRKALFSILGAFLSNIIFIYMLFVIVCNVFKIAKLDFVVSYGSVLWYIIEVNFFFMISRIVHRFAFTYNWYGFRFASLSIFRIIIDTFINFSAVLRSLKVYRQTKKKIVWDSTYHY